MAADSYQHQQRDDHVDDQTHDDHPAAKQAGR
jgi:hypothetical protein